MIAQPKNLCILFFIIGTLGLCFYHFSFKHQVITQKDLLWEISLQVDLPRTSTTKNINIPQPQNSQAIQQISTQAIHPGFIFNPNKNNDLFIESKFTSTGNGSKSIQITWTMEQLLKENNSQRGNKISKVKFNDFLNKRADLPINDTQLITAFNNLKDKLDKVTIQNIFEFCRNILLNPEGSHDPLQVLDQREGSSLGITRLFVSLIRLAGVPSRLNNGIELNHFQDLNWIIWADLYIKNKWVSFNLSNGSIGNIPHNIISFGSPNTRKELDQYNPIWTTQLTSSNTDTKSHFNLFDSLNLNRLPAESKDIIGLLLLMPFAVLFTRAFTAFSGIRSYGTFTPTLLASTFIFVELWITCMLFFSVLIFGILGCYLLPDKISKSPRLSFIFTIITLFLVYFLSSLESIGISANALALLPLVVMTSICDRFFSVLDESGIRIALLRLFWTLIISLFCAIILLIRSIEYFAITYPPIHFYTLGLIVLLSDVNLKLFKKLNLNFLLEPIKKTKKSN